MEIVFNVSSNSFQLVTLENRSFTQQRGENRPLVILGVNFSQASQNDNNLSTDLQGKINDLAEGRIQNSDSNILIKVAQTLEPSTHGHQEDINHLSPNRLDLICRLQTLLEKIYLQIYHKQSVLVEDVFDQIIFMASQIPVEELLSISYTQKLSFLSSQIKGYPLITNKIQAQIMKSVKRILKQQRQYAHNLINGFQSSSNLPSNK